MPSEKNSVVAFQRSFEAGYGTETDFRDLAGELVVSHDPPNKGALPAREFFALYAELGKGLPLAINVKSDGIQDLLQQLLREFQVSNYFVFDMAVPDGLTYLSKGMSTFTRQSEVEPVPAFLDKASGVWLDEFYDHWITPALVRGHLNEGRRICLVSPDLHKRSVGDEWTDYGPLLREFGQKCLLCTDNPDAAKEEVYGKH